MSTTLSFYLGVYISKNMTESKHGRQELAKMVRLDNDVHDRITRIGRMNESYNDVIRRLLDFYEKAHKQ